MARAERGMDGMDREDVALTNATDISEALVIATSSRSSRRPLGLMIGHILH
jgi:hypothetical protein